MSLYNWASIIFHKWNARTSVEKKKENASLHLEDNTSSLWIELFSFLGSDLWISASFFFCGRAFFWLVEQTTPRLFHRFCLYRESALCSVSPAVYCAITLFDFAHSFCLCCACFSHYVKLHECTESSRLRWQACERKPLPLPPLLLTLVKSFVRKALHLTPALFAFHQKSRHSLTAQV